MTLLDVRPADEFAQGHLPGAINIPADELLRRLDAGFPDWRAEGLAVQTPAAAKHR